MYVRVLSSIQSSYIATFIEKNVLNFKDTCVTLAPRAWNPTGKEGETSN